MCKASFLGAVDFVNLTVTEAQKDTVPVTFVKCLSCFDKNSPQNGVFVCVNNMCRDVTINVSVPLHVLASLKLLIGQYFISHGVTFC